MIRKYRYGMNPGVCAYSSYRNQLQDHDAIILAVLAHAVTSLTRWQISRITGIEICSLCKSLHDLVHKQGKVEISHYGRCRTTGKMVMKFKLHRGMGFGLQIRLFEW